MNSQPQHQSDKDTPEYPQNAPLHSNQLDACLIEKLPKDPDLLGKFPMSEERRSECDIKKKEIPLKHLPSTADFLLSSKHEHQSPSILQILQRGIFLI